MSRLRKRLTYANVIATIALFIALGGASYAAFKLPKNSVGARQLKVNSVGPAKLKDNAVTEAKIQNGAITGNKVKLSTLGPVPSATSAQTAQTANSATTAQNLAAPEGMRMVGAGGQPGFNATWTSIADEPTGFYKDKQGIVHLQGAAHVPGATGTQSLVFTLPAGYAPAYQQFFPVLANGSNLGFVYVNANGEVRASDVNQTHFNGITFRAGA